MRAYYRVEADIDLDAIRKNLETMKACVGEDKKLLAVIKANGYGHGSVELAKEMDDISDYYGVANIDEAIELREAGIKKPILILGYTDSSDFEKLVRYDITQTMYNVSACEKLSETALSMNGQARVHIKLDTGMRRIGFPCTEESVESIVAISELKGLNLEGIFTHYAKADEKDKTAANGQLMAFRDMISRLEERNVRFAIKHIGNSAGIMEMDNEGFDMVRSGISTYGLYPSTEMDMEAVTLYPAMRIKSKIIHLKEVNPGEGIGYGWSYIAGRTMKVATIPVGYADGYPRALSNQGRVIIHGQYADIVGRVCMDQMMVDVTEIEDVALLDEVILVGEDGDAMITVEELADASASFNYEFVCNVNRRVPRIYYKEGKPVYEVNYIEKEMK